ncbi:MAG TPA: homoserine kinase [Gemmatimonadales bacterium]
MSAFATVRVPASCSNLGSGFDCLGLALDLWLEARLVEGSGPPRYEGTLAGLDPERDIIATTLKVHGIRQGLRLHARSDIPVGKGLGSSAAAHVAALALGQVASGQAADRDAVFRAAARIEGHPDNAGPAVYGGLFLASVPPSHLSLHPSLGVALAVPQAPIGTTAARALLPTDVSREIAVGQALRAAALVRGLTTGDGDLLRFGMEDLIAVPRRRDLIPGFDQAVDAGRAAGAYGVTISGAGSGLLALAARETAVGVAGAMVAALTKAGNPAAVMVPGVSDQGLSAD